MTAKIFVLDLNPPATEPHKRLELAEGFFFNEVPQVSTDTTKIPTSAEPLILYILGHAFPDALEAANFAPFVQGAQTDSGLISDEDFAKFVKSKRGDSPTLIIWDICFANSFERMPGAGWEDKPYVHVFSCAKHEQTWHTGYPENASGPRPQTLFSIALKQVTAEGPFSTWEELELRLNQKLSPLLHPSITYKAAPSAFDLPRKTEAPTAFEAVVQALLAFPVLLGDLLSKFFALVESTSSVEGAPPNSEHGSEGQAVPR
jgi:hypothetical protein